MILSHAKAVQTFRNKYKPTQIMQEYVGSRLPIFNATEAALVKGA